MAGDLESVDAQPSAAPKVREYFAALPPDARKKLKAVRSAIRAAAPGVTVAFSHGIPAYKLGTAPLVWFAAWTDHIGLHPMSKRIVEANAAALRGCETSADTIRFPLDHPPSAALVQKLIKARVAELRIESRAERLEG